MKHCCRAASPLLIPQADDTLAVWRSCAWTYLIFSYSLFVLHQSYLCALNAKVIFPHLLTQMPHAACLAMEETYFFSRVIICMCCYAVIINQSECCLSTSSQYLTEKSVHYSLHNRIQSLIMNTCQTEWYVTVSSPQFIDYCYTPA